MKCMMAIVFVMASVLALGGCKQGAGERCQVNADCKEPLTCNQATQTCQGESQMQLDANEVPVDAPPDAPHDAAGDAPHD